MVTISARVDESLKGNAEDIAKDIGVSLSTAITVFLKRFVAARGFPFDVIFMELSAVLLRIQIQIHAPRILPICHQEQIN